MQPLFWCQREVGNNVNGHPVGLIRINLLRLLCIRDQPRYPAVQLNHELTNKHTKKREEDLFININKFICRKYSDNIC